MTQPDDEYGIQFNPARALRIEGVGAGLIPHEAAQQILPDDDEQLVYVVGTGLTQLPCPDHPHHVRTVEASGVWLLRIAEFAHLTATLDHMAQHLTEQDRAQWDREYDRAMRKLGDEPMMATDMISEWAKTITPDTFRQEP